MRPSTVVDTGSSSSGLVCNTSPNQAASAIVNPSMLFTISAEVLLLFQLNGLTKYLFFKLLELYSKFSYAQ
jgi:hypothetical protein